MDEPLRFPNRLRATREESVDDRGDGLRRIGRHFVHEPHAERDVGSKTFAGQEPAPGRPGPDLREDERRDDGRNDPQPHLREPEDGVLRGDGDVGARDQAAPSSERIAVNPHHNRSWAAVERLAHPEEA